MISLANGSTIQPIWNTKGTNIRSERAKYHTFFCKNCNKTHYILFTDSICIKGSWYCRKSVKDTMNNNSIKL